MDRGTKQNFYELRRAFCAVFCEHKCDSWELNDTCIMRNFTPEKAKTVKLKDFLKVENFSKK